MAKNETNTMSISAKIDMFLYEFWYYEMGYLSSADIARSVIEKFANKEPFDVDTFLYEFWYYEMGYLSSRDIERSVIEKFSNKEPSKKRELTSEFK